MMPESPSESPNESPLYHQVEDEFYSWFDEIEKEACQDILEEGHKQIMESINRRLYHGQVGWDSIQEIIQDMVEAVSDGVEVRTNEYLRTRFYQDWQEEMRDLGAGRDDPGYGKGPLDPEDCSLEFDEDTGDLLLRVDRPDLIDLYPEEDDIWTLETPEGRMWYSEDSGEWRSREKTDQERFDEFNELFKEMHQGTEGKDHRSNHQVDDERMHRHWVDPVERPNRHRIGPIEPYYEYAPNEASRNFSTDKNTDSGEWPTDNTDEWPLDSAGTDDIPYYIAYDSSDRTGWAVPRSDPGDISISWVVLMITNGEPDLRDNAEKIVRKLGPYKSLDQVVAIMQEIRRIIG